jgi:hypothetical protein
VGFSNWAARYDESARPPLMGHPGLLIQDYVAGIPIWYIPNKEQQIFLGFLIFETRTKGNSKQSRNIFGFFEWQSENSK